MLITTVFLLFGSVTPVESSTQCEKTFGGNSYDIGNYVQHAVNRGFAINGSTEPYGAWSYGIYLVKVVPSASLTLITPNGGENMTSCQTYQITWSSTGSICDVLIKYSTDNGCSWTTIDTVSNTGSYDWPVPPEDSNQCLVCISDTCNPGVSDMSDCVFTITKITAPIVMTLSATNTGPTTAKLWGQIKDDGGEPCQYRFIYRKSDESMAHVTPWTGFVTTGQSFSQTINGLCPSSLYYFRAWARNCAGISNWGNEQTFTTPPGCETLASLLLLTPNGWEELPAGSTYEITWETTGIVENVLIEYSINNGLDWTDVNTVTNTGSYMWEVPDVNSQLCLVYISDPCCPGVNDTSDNTFTIYQCMLAYDLNHDCIVNELDFCLLMSEWQCCGNPFDPNCYDPNCPDPNCFDPNCFDPNCFDPNCSP